MIKCPAIPTELCIIVIGMWLQCANSNTIMVSSSSSGVSSTANCNGTPCASGTSCTTSITSIGYNSTKVKHCTDLAGNSRREEIITTLIGDTECVTNITIVNGNVSSTKNCIQLSARDLKQRQQEWEEQLKVVKGEEKNLSKAMEIEQQAWQHQQAAMDRAWQRQQEAMDQAFKAHAKAMERARLESDRMWETHMKALDNPLKDMERFDMA